MMDEGKYLYCVIQETGDRNFGPIGIGERENEVYTIGNRDLACVVSSTPMAKYVINRKNLTAHEKVIEEVMKGYTVLPVRFCTIATSAEEVRNLLNKRYQEFKNLLRSVDNKVELGLKVYWKNMDTVFKEIAAGSKRIQKLKSKGKSLTSKKTSEVGKEVKRILDKKRDEISEEITDKLKPLCTDIRMNNLVGDKMVFNAAFLVDQMREMEFDDHIENLSENDGAHLKVKYVGPTPPFNFIELDIPWGQEE